MNAGLKIILPASFFLSSSRSRSFPSKEKTKLRLKLFSDYQISLSTYLIFGGETIYFTVSNFPSKFSREAVG